MMRVTPFSPCIVFIVGHPCAVDAPDLGKGLVLGKAVFELHPNSAFVMNAIPNALINKAITNNM